MKRKRDRRDKVHYLTEDGNKLCWNKIIDEPKTTTDKSKVTCKYCLHMLFPPTNCKRCNRRFTEQNPRYGRNLLCVRCGKKMAREKSQRKRKDYLHIMSPLDEDSIMYPADPRWRLEKYHRMLAHQQRADEARKTLSTKQFKG